MKKVPPNVPLLRSSPALGGTRDRDLFRLALLFDDVRVEAGAVLAREGTPCHELVLVVEGTVTTSVRGERVGVIGAGGVLGESAILDHAPHRVTATTRTPTRVLVAGCESCRELRGDPAILRLIANDLAGQLGRLRGSSAMRRERAPRRPEVARTGAGGWRLGM